MSKEQTEINELFEKKSLTEKCLTAPEILKNYELGLTLPQTPYVKLADVIQWLQQNIIVRESDGTYWSTQIENHNATIRELLAEVEG